MEEVSSAYSKIEKAIFFLTENFDRQPELDEVASYVHLSPFHFQKLFTAWAGISPKRFVQFLTVNSLKERLSKTKNQIEAAEQAGLSSQSRVYDLFTRLEAVTPEEYKQKGAQLVIKYGFHFTPFGKCLIATTQRGVCWLSLFKESDSESDQLNLLKAYWNNSVIQPHPKATQQLIDQIFSRSGHPGSVSALVKGTNFQIKVWQALLEIPSGSVTSYQEVAKNINQPSALQAVGNAVGANKIAYLIPCHRVIKKNGILGEYRWSAARKRAILGWEIANEESGNLKKLMS